MSLLCKLIPCVVLLVMSALLVVALRRLQHLSKNLLKNGRERKSVRSYRGTTHLILAVMGLFLAVELPQGLLTLLSFMPAVRFRYYYPLGDLFEMLTVLYSSINFVLFCLMSSPFRAALGAQFCWLCGASADGRGR